MTAKQRKGFKVLGSIEQQAKGLVAPVKDSLVPVDIEVMQLLIYFAMLLIVDHQQLHYKWRNKKEAHQCDTDIYNGMSI